MVCWSSYIIFSRSSIAWFDCWISAMYYDAVSWSRCCWCSASSCSNSCFESLRYCSTYFRSKTWHCCYLHRFSSSEMRCFCSSICFACLSIFFYILVYFSSDFWSNWSNSVWWSSAALCSLSSLTILISSSCCSARSKASFLRASSAATDLADSQYWKLLVYSSATWRSNEVLISRRSWICALSSSVSFGLLEF